MSVPEEITRDHWWWRPGWRLGRSFYTWHITFLGQPRIGDFISSYTPVIERFPSLDQVPLAGLHLTIQGIGFTDEIDRSMINKIVEATRNRCAQIKPFRVEIGPAHVDPETIQMPVHPADSIIGLRAALRRGIGDIWGQENVPESMDGFRPHVTVAYSSGRTRISDIESVLRDSELVTTEATISKVSLIELNRDRKRYEWSEVSTVSFE